MEKALVCNSLTVPGYLCHDNRVGFHFKGTAESLKDFLFLLVVSFSVSSVWLRYGEGQLLEEEDTCVGFLQ